MSCQLTDTAVTWSPESELPRLGSVQSFRAEWRGPRGSQPRGRSSPLTSATRMSGGPHPLSRGFPWWTAPSSALPGKCFATFLHWWGKHKSETPKTTEPRTSIVRRSVRFPWGSYQVPTSQCLRANTVCERHARHTQPSMKRLDGPLNNDCEGKSQETMDSQPRLRTTLWQKTKLAVAPNQFHPIQYGGQRVFVNGVAIRPIEGKRGEHRSVGLPQPRRLHPPPRDEGSSP